jgi:hypothetical protein
LEGLARYLGYVGSLAAPLAIALAAGIAATGAWAAFSVAESF